MAPPAGEEGEQAPLVGFLFGNVDENNRVEADYLDEEAKEHLSGLARVQGGAELQAELQAEGERSATEGGAASAAAVVQPAADALDFADEAELIEDAEAAAAAAAALAAEQQRQLGVVTVALQAGGAAEEEDYDFDEEPAAVGAAAAAPAVPSVRPGLQPSAVPLPALGTFGPTAATQPAAPAAAVPQMVAAQQRHVRLPVIGRSIDGETVLRFSELYGYQGVMAGHVASVEELRPPPLLPRAQQRQATQRRKPPPQPAEAQAEDDEEALMLTADLEVPAEEEIDDEEEQQDRDGQELAAAPAAAPQGAPGATSQQRSRGSRPAREQPKQVAVAAAGAEGQEGLAEDDGDAAAAGRGGADASPSATTFAPVNAITWEDRVCWQGATGAESEHETDDENEAAGSAAAAAPAPAAEGGPAWVHADQPQETFGDAGLPPPGAAHPAFGESLQQPGGEQPQWNQLHTQPPLDAQEQALMAQPDIAAMFAQQPPVAQQPGLGGVSLDTGLPTNGMPYVPGGTDAAAQAVPLQSSQWDQQQPTANGWPTQQLGQPFEAFAAAPMPADYSDLPSELPGLGGASAAQLEALAAAESDEEEYFTMPTAPLLRLERLALFAEEEGREGQQGDRRLQTAPDMLPVHREAWEERIAWDGLKDAERVRMSSAVYDLNDANQTFELAQPVPAQPAAAPAARGSAESADMAALVKQAAALILQPQAASLPLPPRGSGFDPSNPEEVELWRLQQGLAREREYHQLAKRKAGTAGTVRVLHAKLAVDLATIPILNPSSTHSQEEALALELWHTPRGKWWPLEVSRVTWNVGGGKKGKGSGSGPVTVTISSLPGLSKVFASVGLDARLHDLWKHLVDNIALFKQAEKQRPIMLVPGRPPLALPLDQPLMATGAVKQGQKQVKLAVAFQDIELLPTDTIAAVPAGDNPALLRPPNAFTRKRDFSAAEPGHVVLLEYMEQQPPLLNRPGMGAKLVTYYRKQKADDVGHQKLKQEEQRWRVGAVQPLGDDDDSPFLGQLAKGSSTLSVESGLYRSLAHPYDPPNTDFLLLRSPAGTMQLRELNGTVIVGQELPMLRVPAPTAREVKDLEERRIYVYVFKHLRRQQAKLDKDPTKQGQRASITLKTLAEAFPSRPPAMIRAYLKDACDLAVRPLGETEVFSLKEGARPPSEAELRKKLTPEETCALEACYVAAFRMKLRGLRLHDKLDKAAIEKLRLAAEMLPPDESYQKAARLVEQAMMSAPWTLTDAFVAHFREGKAQLQLAGAADPTGRGFGYSFVRDVRHKHANADDVTKQMAKRQAGKVQGTDADLRRMTTAQARERLRNYGLTEDEIQGLGRWTMIDMVRQLASAAAQDGTVDAAAVKFVRHQKTTLIELQRRAAEKAQQILEKQLAVLNNSAAEDLGDQEALEAELERELAAAEAADEGAAVPTPQGKKGKREGTPTPDDEQRMMQQMRAEGLMATAAGGDAVAPSEGASTFPAGSGGPPPKDGPGTKRIRREVFMKAADGSWQKSHEIIYIGRDRPGQLHSLYQKEGAGNYPYGFGTRTVAGRPKELRLSYAAARGRGIGRAAPRPGGGGGRGRGRGRGAKAMLEEPLPNVGKARQSSRQRKTKQFDDLLDDELISDIDFDYNEEMEAPYFAATAEKEPKPKKSKKKKKEEGGEGAAALPGEGPMMEAPAALPDDFAAALAAATMVRAPSAPAAEHQQPPQHEELSEQQRAASAGAGPASAGAPPDQLPSGAMFAAEAAAQPQDVQQPAVTTQLPPSKPKFKIKLGGAAPAQPKPQREPSPEFVYDYTMPDEEEELRQPGRGRGAKAKDEDYEAPADEGSEDEFVPDDEEISEEEHEERQYLKKARRSRNYDGLPLARSASRRSGGSARSRGAGGGGAKKKAAGGGTRRSGGGGGGGVGAKRKRSRADFDEVEFEEEFDEDVELSDEDDVETLDDDDEDAGTSDDAGTAPKPRQRVSAGGGGAIAPPGQLGTVGRQLGTILSSIVQQLRSVKKPWNGKQTKVYELVFGKVPSAKHTPDYHTWVPKAQVIILPDVQKKAKAGRYLTLEQFRADLQQLYKNAVAYNTPGNGQSGDPYFINMAAELLEDAERLISQNLNEIEAAEAGQRYGAYQQQQVHQQFGISHPPHF